ncbi:MAG: hypothetical protein PHQ12_00240 [Chthoniobacteraceae bacterium]|nr:hypothetical protein [Chthoniobacteraceae bacterium]
MIRFFLILLLTAFGALVVQFYIPPLAFLYGARVLLLPLVFFFGALALPFPGMLALAFACGLMWDALTAQVLDIGMGPTSARVVEIGMGWSVLLYAILGALMSGFKPLFQRGRWEIHCLLSGVCTSLIVLAEFFMISVRRAAFYNVPIEVSPDIWWRIGGPGLVALVLAPGVFFFLKSLAALVGYNPAAPELPEEEA